PNLGRTGTACTKFRKIGLKNAPSREGENWKQTAGGTLQNRTTALVKEKEPREDDGRGENRSDKPGSKIRYTRMK
ncbi:Bumetanide-sensitive sodium-(potassium)-chloride cotransporter, partial [Trichinella pseudospiralis]